MKYNFFFPGSYESTFLFSAWYKIVLTVIYSNSYKSNAVKLN